MKMKRKYTASLAIPLAIALPGCVAPGVYRTHHHRHYRPRVYIAEEPCHTHCYRTDSRGIKQRRRAANFIDWQIRTGKHPFDVWRTIEEARRQIERGEDRRFWDRHRRVRRDAESRMRQLDQAYRQYRRHHH